MTEILQDNWIYILAAVLIGILVGWIIFGRQNRITVETDKKDALDEDGAKATRNQALIDAPSAARGGASVAAAKTAATATGNEASTPPPQAAGGSSDAVASPKSEAAPPSPSSNQDRQAGTMAEEAGAEVQPNGGDVAAQEREGDDLTRIKGIGPRLSDMLNAIGVSRIDQIANWDAEDIARIDPQLGRFEGRIERDSWVRQAQLLSAGDTKTYEENFGKLNS